LHQRDALVFLHLGHGAIHITTIESSLKSLRLNFQWNLQSEYLLIMLTHPCYAILFLNLIINFNIQMLFINLQLILTTLWLDIFLLHHFELDLFDLSDTHLVFWLFTRIVILPSRSCNGSIRLRSFNIFLHELTYFINTHLESFVSFCIDSLDSPYWHVLMLL